MITFSKEVNYMEYQEQYKKLVSIATKQNPDIINSKKRLAWEYFRNMLIPINNLENNLSKQFIVNVSEVKSVHGSNMVCWPFKDKIDIFIDKELYNNNQILVNIQLQHEVLHGLSQTRNNVQNSFGHPIINGDTIYVGIDEAVTQMFAEDIQNVRLSSNEDYLFYVKNVMRVLKSIFGSESIANQYLNGNTSFEDTINKLMDYKFEPFAMMMKKIYILNKKEFYNKLSQEENIEKTKIENQINSFLANIILKISDQDINSSIVHEVDKEFIEKFKAQLGIEFEKNLK